ncbi:MAG: hypothetical protein V4736_04155 [Bdellovibrionota bacterium]
MGKFATKLFPPVYSHWLETRLNGTVTESLATCDNCAMVTPSGLTRDPGPFKNHLKCCTYFPFIPNFGLGAMINAKSAEATLRLRTAQQQGILLPLGLHTTPERQLQIESFGTEGFGKHDELICPFFDKQSFGCSVWQFRPGVCTTYFCKSDRGFEGLDFWGEVESYLNNFEWTLAKEVYFRLGFTEDDFEMCKATMSIEEPGEEREHFLNASWGKWISKKD